MKVFIWFLVFLPAVYAAENYDYFQLVLQWPPTVCRGLTNCAYPNPKMNFTIHGLWLSDSTIPERPINCPGSPFDPSKIKELIPRLDKYCPNLTGDNEYFWKNQWETHGTRSEDRFNEPAYFLKALDLKENVEHGTGHKFNGTSHKPRLWCKDNELLEISVCYDLDLAYMDCPPQLLNNPRNKCDECVGYLPYPDPPYPTENGIEEKNSGAAS